jgi:D-glycero-D-manno-heptose 1,7-bisphosphate phosphatase
MRRAVFLDRDGVINRGLVRHGKPAAPFSVAELEILPGVRQALGQLRDAGFLLIVVTNQPEVGRGSGSREDVEAIHRYLRSTLPLDDIRVCYHDDDAKCACRKPEPGMVYAAAVDHQVQLAASFLVGDRWRDVAAGKAAGCKTVLVNAFPEPTYVEPDVALADLPAATRWILEQNHP